MGVNSATYCDSIQIEYHPGESDIQAHCLLQGQDLTIPFYNKQAQTAYSKRIHTIDNTQK